MLRREPPNANLNLVTSCRGALLAVGVWAVWEERFEEVIARACNQIKQILH